jgi:transposase-like protein
VAPGREVRRDHCHGTGHHLKQWKKQLAALPATGPGQRSTLQLEEENRRLKRELQHVSRQRDILKKTLGILSADGSVLNVYSKLY